MKLFNPEIKLIRKDTLKKLILKEFELLRAEVKNLIQATDNRVSCTTDLWTSNTMESYMAITIHFITEDFVRHNFLLDFFMFQPWKT